MFHCLPLPSLFRFLSLLPFIISTMMKYPRPVNFRVAETIRKEWYNILTPSSLHKLSSILQLGPFFLISQYFLLLIHEQNLWNLENNLHVLTELRKSTKTNLRSQFPKFLERILLSQTQTWCFRCSGKIFHQRSLERR